MIFLRDESGQGMVEYALIIALISVLLIVSLLLLRNTIKKTYYDTIESGLNQTVTEE